MGQGQRHSLACGCKPTLESQLNTTIPGFGNTVPWFCLKHLRGNLVHTLKKRENWKSDDAQGCKTSLSE
jgi:hypothetical protein